MSRTGHGGVVDGRNPRLVNVFGVLRPAGPPPEDRFQQEDLSWEDQALCAEVDPEIFFVEKGGSTAPAKRVCRACEVRAECLDYALRHDERFGVYGGMSERERRRLKRRAVPAGDLITAADADQDGRREAADADFLLRGHPAAGPDPQSRKAA